MSSSQPGRMVSSASRIVTLEPRSASSEANSHPTTPPPMTTTEAGSSLRSRNSSDVMIRRPSTSKPGSRNGTDPAARTTLRPTMTRPASSPSTTSTRWSALSVPVTGQRGDLAPLEQSGQALEELVHHGVLAVLAHREVDRDAGGVDAELLGALDRPVDGGRLEEFLGRDAAAVQTGATYLVPLDDGDGEARRGPVERSGVAAGTTADHDDVELVLACHRRSSSFVLTTSVRRARPPRNNPIALARVLSMPCALPLQPTFRTIPPSPAPAQFSRSFRSPDRPPGWPTRRPCRSSGHPSGP